MYQVVSITNINLYGVCLNKGYNRDDISLTFADSKLNI